MSYYNSNIPNGYIERKPHGKYEGELIIDGIDISPIECQMFQNDGKKYLWLKRKDMLVYDAQEQRYITRKREPRWEAYLEKGTEGNLTIYKGEFCFFMFRFSIKGIWDEVFGKEKSRMNFYIDRLALDKQDIINGINQRMNND